MDRLLGSAPDTKVFTTPSSSYKASDISTLKAALLKSAQNFQARLAIYSHSHSEVNIALSIVLLDEVAKALLLLPSELDISKQAELATRADCELLEVDGFIKNLQAVELNLNKFDSTNSPANKTDEVDTAYILATSGTTGTPKLLRHSLSGLMATTKRAKNAEQSKPTKPPYIWGLLYAPERFAGLQVVLQALASGQELLLSDGELELKARLEFFAKHKVSCLSATPTLWRKILMSPVAKRLQLSSITLGGEIVDEGILKALRLAYPAARICHIYASSEAGVGFSVKDGHAGFPAEFLGSSDARELKGITLKLSPDSTLMIKSTRSSEGLVESNAPKGLDGKNDSTTSKSVLKTPDGFIDTGDIIEVVGERAYFKGRNSSVINIGGSKISAEAIERVLLGVNGVALASITTQKSSILGQLIIAHIVPADANVNEEALRRAMQEAVRENLPPFAKVARYSFVDSLDTNASGKLARPAG